MTWLTVDEWQPLRVALDVEASDAQLDGDSEAIDERFVFCDIV